MRLVATISDEKEAMSFRALLMQEGIDPFCEAGTTQGKRVFHIWVMNEDRLEEAVNLYEKFQQDPSIAPKAPPPEESPPKEKEELPPPRIPTMIRGRRSFPAPLTKWIILICGIFFITNLFLLSSLRKQHPSYAKYFGYTALNIALFYDYTPIMEKYRVFLYAHPDINLEKIDEVPLEERLALVRIERTPHWQGLYYYFLSSEQKLAPPPFHKISQGQIWRLFTPALMHGGFLHILFNMLWLWMLGRFVERNIKAWRYLLLMVVVGVISNTCQYLMSGPSFLGFSGIVSGLAGFIFIRQRAAPWEDYPLPKATLIFLAIFIVGMAVFQAIAFFLQKFALANIPLNVANTAHVSGAICGMVLAKFKLFEAQ